MSNFIFPEFGRVLAAALAVLAYAGFCVLMYRRAQAARSVVSLQPEGSPDTAAAVFVIHASQTGQARALAEQTAQGLLAQGEAVRLYAIDQPWQAELGAAARLLFVVSTYGEGDAPDHARSFARQIAQAAALQGVRYGLLALGDRTYPAFCAFGRRLDAWLQASGAEPLFERIELDRLDETGLRDWHTRVLGAAQPLPAYASWRLLGRECLNPGSSAEALYKLRLAPEQGELPGWQAGDLVDVLIPGGDGRPRTYSIANLPGDGVLELIVRSVRRSDGTRGQTSGWLNERAQAGDQLELKLRSNPGCNLAQDLARPLILIGAGSGLAGLRGHLQTRAQLTARASLLQPERNAWLIFGERTAAFDSLCAEEIAAWQQAGVISRLDRVFSRDTPDAPYVQHRLLAQADELRAWLQAGADILVCGCAQTLAVGVDQALRSVLGDTEVEALLAAGRLRRDVF